MIRYSEEEAKELLGNKYSKTAPKKQKYNAKKVTVDGITFDSKREAEYYCTLKLKVVAGEVESFELQPEFILQESFMDKHGHKVRAIKYRADFRVAYTDKRVEIVDTKGYRTKEYQIKKKLLLAKYPDIDFIEA
jgi:hypothetical protein